MQKAAIYVRDPLTTAGSIISKEDQENACREYCQARGPHSLSHVHGHGRQPGRVHQDDLRRPPLNDSTLDFIVVWKLNRFSMSLEDTIDLRDKLRRVGTKLVSTTERGID